MRWLAAVLALFLLWPSEDGDAWRFMAGGAGNAPPTLTFPCDVITGGCAEAHSTAFAMSSAYAGKLFQLTRISDNATLDVGVTGAHVADLSSVPTFCHLTTCYYTKLYGLVNPLNTMFPSLASQGGLIPPECGSSGYHCAPLFWIDPTNGFPAISTIWPSQLSLDACTGINSHTNPISIVVATSNVNQSQATGGPYAICHQASAPDTTGTSLGLAPFYGVSGPNGLANTFFEAMGYEGTGDGAVCNNTNCSASSLVDNLIVFSSFTGGSGTNTVTTIINGVTLYSGSPPGFTVGTPTTLNPGIALSIGGGGDNGHVDSLFRAGFFSNSALSSGDEAASRAAIVGLLVSGSAPTCNGTTHMGYYWYPETQGPASLNNKIPIDKTWVGWGLYQMRPDYYGPIATLKNALGASNTYGPDLSGNCQIDGAAATFCTANPPCTVTVLFNQGSFSHDTVSHPIPDSSFNFSTIIFSGGPSVTFNSLNGLPTMHFSGAQSLCTPSFSTIPIAGDNPLTIAAVVRRGTTSGASWVFGSEGSLPDAYIGFAAGAATANFQLPGATGTEAATDNHWHSIAWESSSTTAALPYVDGVAGSPISFSATTPTLATFFCMGGHTGGTLNFVGDIAEMSVTNSRAPGAPNFGTVLPALFAVEEATWGTLPN